MTPERQISDQVNLRLTQQQKARTQMTTKATGLCVKYRRAVGVVVSRIQKKKWNFTHVPTKNATKRPQTEG